MKEKTLDDYIYYSLIIASIILILLVIIYNAFFSDIPIFSCYIYDNFHIYCPGCGSTRAFISLLNFDIIKSFYYNSAVLYSVIILFLYLFTQTNDRLFKHKKYLMPYSNFYLYTGICILLFNCIIRNVLLLMFKIPL